MISAVTRRKPVNYSSNTVATSQPSMDYMPVPSSIIASGTVYPQMPSQQMLDSAKPMRPPPPVPHRVSAGTHQETSVASQSPPPPPARKSYHSISAVSTMSNLSSSPKQDMTSPTPSAAAASSVLARASNVLMKSSSISDLSRPYPGGAPESKRPQELAPTDRLAAYREKATSTCPRCSDGSSWKDLYESLYEKTQSTDRAYESRIQELSDRVKHLENELHELHRRHADLKRDDIKPDPAQLAAVPEGELTPEDLIKMMRAGVGALDQKAAEIQDTTMLIKKKLGVSTEPPVSVAAAPMPPKPSIPAPVLKAAEPATQPGPSAPPKSVDAKTTSDPPVAKPAPREATVSNKVKPGGSDSSSAPSGKFSSAVAAMRERLEASKKTGENTSIPLSKMSSSSRLKLEPVKAVVAQKVEPTIKTAAEQTKTAVSAEQIQTAPAAEVAVSVTPRKTSEGGGFKSDLLDIMNSFGF